MLRTEGGHFWLTFKNGYTISVFNGYGSHTENRDKLEKWEKIYILDKDPFENYWESKFVEVAIIDSYGHLVTDEILGCDDLVTTVDLDELIVVINKVYNL